MQEKGVVYNQICLFLDERDKNYRTIYIPQECQTLHPFIPRRLVYTKKFNNFLFQCFYFAYPFHINKHISKPKKTIYKSINVELKLKSSEDVYIIDMTEANKYYNDKNNNNKNDFEIMTDDTLTQYYLYMALTFRKLNEISSDDYITYKNPVFLIQRAIDFNNEIINILQSGYCKKFKDISDDNLYQIDLNDNQKSKKIKKSKKSNNCKVS